MIRANVTTRKLKVLHREFKYNILVRERAINLRKSLQLSLHVDKVFRIKIYINVLVPSTLYLMRLPTISVGYTMS